MFSRNLSVPDFVRRFFVSCAQISEAYVDEIRVRLAEKSATKAGAGKTSERTYYLYYTHYKSFQTTFQSTITVIEL